MCHVVHSIGTMHIKLNCHTINNSIQITSKLPITIYSMKLIVLREGVNETICFFVEQFHYYDLSSVRTAWDEQHA